MTVILKVDKGTAEKLVDENKIKEDDVKNLSGEEVELNIEDGDFFIEKLKEKHKEFLELSDVEGTFSLWFDLTEERKEKLKKALGL